MKKILAVTSLSLCLICVFSSASPFPLQMVERIPKPTHAEFWDLCVNYIEVKGNKYYKPAGSVKEDQKYELRVTVGEEVTFNCHYLIKTINVSQITKKDAKYWGTGRHRYMTNAGIWLTLSALKATYALPEFTYEELQHRRHPFPYVRWKRNFVFRWTPKLEDIGKNYLLYFRVDWKNDIEEFDETNNDILFDSPSLAIRIIVRPKMVIKKIKK
jgi:hypothetical protein